MRNDIVADAEWDQGKLRIEFRELLEIGFDVDLTGIDAVEIDMTLDIEEATSGVVEEADEQDLVPSSEAALVVPRDIWMLGGHLIACGDSQDAELLRRLIGERKAAVVFTDPPFNVKIAGNVSGLGKITHREFAMGGDDIEPVVLVEDRPGDRTQLQRVAPFAETKKVPTKGCKWLKASTGK